MSDDRKVVSSRQASALYALQRSIDPAMALHGLYGKALADFNREADRLADEEGRVLGAVIVTVTVEGVMELAER
jgi:hypothetical protein